MPVLYHHSSRTDAKAILERKAFQDDPGMHGASALAAGIFLSDRPQFPPQSQSREALLVVSVALSNIELQQWEVRHEGQTYRQWCIPAVILNANCTIQDMGEETTAEEDGEIPPEEIDFNAKYCLKPDDVMPARDLLQIHPITASFVRADTGQPPSLEDVQGMLSTTLLIPSVPDDVRRTFTIAKRLHLFGYFEYSFFTVSQHYAFLALEAAIYKRWTMTLPRPTPVEVPPHPPHTLHSPKHEDLFRLWNSTKRQLTVNGQPFPNSVDKVLGRLEAAGLVKSAERERITAAMHLRNDLSHLESATVTTPQPGILRITAGFINVIFGRRGRVK